MAAALLLTACGGETTVARTEDGTITRSSDNSYRVETADGATGTMTSGGAALDQGVREIASRLPAWAPLYPGSRPIHSMSGTDGQGASGQAVVLESRDSLADIVRFYDERIAASGAQAQMRADQGDTAMRVVGDPQGQTGTMLSINDGGDVRTITITISSQG
jgi:hypothetical protein